MPDLNLAIAGDLHDQWDASDHELLARIRPDALLLVGDFSDGDSRIPTLLAGLDLPLACVIGNHDTGKDGSGRRLRQQLSLLGDRHCGWGLRQLTPPGLAVVGARPGTAGGGFQLSRAVRSVYGPVSQQESADRITRAALSADPALPLVVFGHMHHTLRHNRGERLSFQRDGEGTAYLNCACVPRHGTDLQGRSLRHLSWVRLRGTAPVHISHRWYDPGGALLYEEVLWQGDPRPEPQPVAGLAGRC